MMPGNTWPVTVPGTRLSVDFREICCTRVGGRQVRLFSPKFLVPGVAPDWNSEELLTVTVLIA
eukprot:2850698-Rhodomonas_salina.1